MVIPEPNTLERRLQRLELVALDSMKASVADYFRRVPSGPKSRPRWTLEMYPKGTEKELYGQFGHILLSAPGVMVPALLRVLDAPASQLPEYSRLSGTWRAYRISTVRLERPARGSDPMCFPGAAGRGGIADVGLFLNPRYDGADGKQMRADLILYFEIKSADHQRHQRSQLQAHLTALQEQTPDSAAFLAGVGGKPIQIQHQRWLGHVTLDGFLEETAEVARTELRNTGLSGDIEGLRLFKNGSA